MNSCMASMVMTPNQQYKKNEKTTQSKKGRNEDDIEDVQVHRDGGRYLDSKERLLLCEQARGDRTTDSQSGEPDDRPSGTGKVVDELIELSESRVKRLERSMQEEAEYGGQLKSLLQKLRELPG
jgi:hypothetical protein